MAAAYLSLGMNIRTGRRIVTCTYFRAPPRLDSKLRLRHFSRRWIDTSTFYMATFPNMWPQVAMTPCGTVSKYIESLVYNVVANASVLSCELFNSTYEIELLYENGRQTITTVSPPKIHKDSLIDGGIGGHYRYNKISNDWSLFSWGNDTLSLEGQAYRAIMQAFAGFFRGSVSSTEKEMGMRASDGTGVMQTRLANTAEFANILIDRP